LGVEIKEKQMKKQFAKLSKTEQAKVEAWYHEQNPEGFDDIMGRASTHSPDVIRLPPQLTARLKTLAKREGEPEYQTMVTRWLKERVQKETRAASKSAKKRERNRGSGFKRQATK
jgi:hypothetical protein